MGADRLAILARRRSILLFALFTALPVVTTILLSQDTTTVLLTL